MAAHFVKMTAECGGYQPSDIHLPLDSARAIEGPLKTPEGFNLTQEALAIHAFAIGVVQFGDFVLAHSGNRSPVYFECRRIFGDRRVMTEAIKAYQEKLETIEYDLLAGVPVGAIPFESVLGWVLWSDVVIPRREAKAYGTASRVDGFSERHKGQTAVLIEDALSTGQSALEAAGGLRELGIKVNDVVVLIDREQGGPQLLGKNSLTVHPVFTMRQLINFYLRTGAIKPEWYGQVISFLATSQ